MIGPLLLAFTGGALAGVVVAWLVFKQLSKTLVNLPAPSINHVECLAGGQARIDVTLGEIPDGATLIELHTLVDDDPNAAVGACPPAGATAQAIPADPSSFSLVHNLPPGLSGPDDLAVVWAIYRVCVKGTSVFESCSGSGSGSDAIEFGATRADSAAAEQLEAIPRAYQVSPGSPPAAAGGGPAAVLVGALAGAPDAVLRYVPEASTPVEPFWRARGGPGPVLEWSLRLLHRDGGFGALLSAVCVVGGREVRLTWVTSDWRFHAANRLACESDEAGGPALLVRPA